MSTPSTGLLSSLFPNKKEKDHARTSSTSTLFQPQTTPVKRKSKEDIPTVSPVTTASGSKHKRNASSMIFTVPAVSALSPSIDIEKAPVSMSISLLYKTGYLRKFGPNLKINSLNSRFFKLYHNMLKYYKVDPQAKPQGTVPLKSSKLDRPEDDKFVKSLNIPPAAVRLGENLSQCILTIESIHRKYVIVTPTRKERDIWYHALLQHVDESKRQDMDLRVEVEGWIYKSDESYKSWKRRFCCLYARAQELHYFKQAPIECAGEIPLEKCTISFGVIKSPDGKVNGTQQVDGEIFSITPADSQRQYVMVAQNMTDCSRWQSAIRTAMSDQHHLRLEFEAHGEFHVVQKPLKGISESPVENSLTDSGLTSSIAFAKDIDLDDNMFADFYFDGTKEGAAANAQALAASSPSRDAKSDDDDDDE